VQMIKQRKVYRMRMLLQTIRHRKRVQGIALGKFLKYKMNDEISTTCIPWLKNFILFTNNFGWFLKAYASISKWFMLVTNILFMKVFVWCIPV
jgi:hypothetical protein